MWWHFVALYLVLQIGALGLVLLRRGSARAERRAQPRLRFRFRALDGPLQADDAPGDLSAGGAAVVLSYASASPGLELEVPVGQDSPLHLCGKVVALTPCATGFTHHLRFVDEEPRARLEALLDGGLGAPLPS